MSVILHLSLLVLVLSHFHLPHKDKENTHNYYVSIDIKTSDLSPSKKLKSSKNLVKTQKFISKLKPNATLKNNTHLPNKNSKLANASAPPESPEKLSYKEELYQFLKNKDHYPPIAAKLKHSGSVQVRIKINKDGKFIDVDLISPSNHKTLNQGTLSFLKKIAYFKPLPKLLKSQTFEVPIVYEL